MKCLATLQRLLSDAFASYSVVASESAIHNVIPTLEAQTNYVAVTVRNVEQVLGDEAAQI